MPTISDDDRSITFVFSKPYVDWEIVGMNPNIPAHILWQEAFPDDSATGDDAAAKVRAAIEDDDTDTLKALGTAFKDKWTVDSMPDDEKLLVSSGAYTVSSFVKDQYITLTARKDYKNGPQPKVAKFTMRFIPDQTAQVQALENGEVSLLYGQATSDTVKALEGVGDNITTTTSPAASYEHVDLNFDIKGPFSPSSYGGDADKALKVRQAFFHAIPRDEMLDRIIKPLSDDAQLDDSALFLPGGEGYDEAVKQGDYSKYQSADPAAAKQLLKEAGVSTPVKVRFAYATDNPRRVQEFQLIQSAAKDAGFDVVDVGVPAATFFGDKGVAGETYQWDASVFAYVLSSLSVGSSQGNTSCDNAYNYGGYCNKQVDAWWQQAAQSSSYSEAVPYMAKIDAQLNKDAMSLSLYQLPDVSAWESNIQNVKNAPLTPNIFWNYFDWSIAK
jgi:peptide/nickel transport system substrate-binding protein